MFAPWLNKTSEELDCDQLLTQVEFKKGLKGQIGKNCPKLTKFGVVTHDILLIEYYLSKTWSVSFFYTCQDKIGKEGKLQKISYVNENCIHYS